MAPRKDPKKPAPSQSGLEDDVFDEDFKTFLRNRLDEMSSTLESVVSSLKVVETKTTDNTKKIDDALKTLKALETKTAENTGDIRDFVNSLDFESERISTQENTSRI